MLSKTNRLSTKRTHKIIK